MDFSLSLIDISSGINSCNTTINRLREILENVKNSYNKLVPNGWSGQSADSFKLSMDSWYASYSNSISKLENLRDILKNVEDMTKALNREALHFSETLGGSSGSEKEQDVVSLNKEEKSAAYNACLAWSEESYEAQKHSLRQITQEVGRLELSKIPIADDVVHYINVVVNMQRKLSSYGEAISNYETGVNDLETYVNGEMAQITQDGTYIGRVNLDVVNSVLALVSTTALLEMDLSTLSEDRQREIVEELMRRVEAGEDVEEINAALFGNWREELENVRALHPGVDTVTATLSHTWDLPDGSQVIYSIYVTEGEGGPILTRDYDPTANAYAWYTNYSKIYNTEAGEHGVLFGPYWTISDTDIGRRLYGIVCEEDGEFKLSASQIHETTLEEGLVLGTSVEYRESLNVNISQVEEILMESSVPAVEEPEEEFWLVSGWNWVVDRVSDVAEVVSDVVDGAIDVVTDIGQGISDFVNEHPIISGAVATVAVVTLGAVAIYLGVPTSIVTGISTAVGFFSQNPSLAQALAY